MIPEFNLLLVAIFSRVYYLSLSYLASKAIYPYDKSRSLVNTDSPFKFLLSWDTFHFYNIAENGYLAEHTYAFFPLYPYLVRVISQITGIDTLSIGVLLSNLCFILSSVILYRLSVQRMSPHHAYLSTIFYSFNPASIVYSSMYTESIFTLLFLLAIYNFGKNRHINVLLLLVLATMCRSNAILFIVFLKYKLWPAFLIPISLFQLYCLAMTSFKTCQFMPYIPYSRVQRIYWDQGPFRFYTMANLPNLFVGLPFILYSLYVLYLYVVERGDKIIHFVKQASGVVIMNATRKLIAYVKNWSGENQKCGYSNGENIKTRNIIDQEECDKTCDSHYSRIYDQEECDKTCDLHSSR